MNLTNEMKKLFLAGIGAVAVTAEKGKEVVDELVEKGELTIEQGKILNEELKHNIKEKFSTPATAQTIVSDLEKVNKDELAKIKAKIEELEKEMNEDSSASQNDAN